MKQTLLYTSCVAAFLMSSSICAEEQMEQHGAHEHGVAKLSVAVGDEGLEIMLVSPAANLLGFEHAATTDEDKQKLADVKAKLEESTDLFSISPEAECELKNVEVLSALLEDAEQAGHADHEHEHEAHNDMDVTWSYACAKPAALKELEVKLFTAFPEGLEHIKAEWVTDKGASAQELDKDDTLKIN